MRLTARWLAPVLLVSVAACTGEQPPAPGPGTSPLTSGSSADATATPTTLSRPPPADSPPVDGPCPYLPTDVVQETVGQHIDRTTTTVTDPALPPDCAFFRPDGDPAAVIELAGYPTAAEAQIAAIALGTPAANPVDDVGDGGVVLVTEDAAVLAVTVGPTLLVVRINQASSLQARTLAATVAPLL